MDDFKALLDKYSGMDVPIDAVKFYIRLAGKKRARILARYGDAGGRRLLPAYLARLAAEEMRIHILYAACLEHCAARNGGKPCQTGF